MIRNLKRKNIIILKDIIFSIIGCIFISAGIVFFLLPLKISAGGFSGIATITYYLFNLKLGTVIWILNIPLLIIGFFRIGKYFFFKTMFATWLLSFCINFFENMNLFLNIDDILLSAIYGGVIIGIGTTCIFKANNSTGGTELLIQIILSYKDNIKVSKLLIIIDSIIVGLNLIIFKQIEIGLYSFIVIFLNSKIVDLFIEGVNFTKIVYIISDKSTEISNKILNDLDKGLSGIYGKGMYQNKEKLILMCVIKKRDLIKLKEIVKQVDDAAFMIISDAIDVYGLGFTKESKI
mgnify:CR=1 FL=1